MQSVSEKLAEVLAPKPEKRNWEAEVLPMLPPGIQAPLVYSQPAVYYSKEGYSIGWSDKSYGRGIYNPVEILQALESHGFVPCEVTLVKWDNYRPGPAPYTAETLPGNGNYEVTDLWPMLPCWLRANQYTSPEFHAYYIYNGRRFSVKLDIPHTLISVLARRVEFRGGWKYDSATARLMHPDKLHDIRNSEGEIVAMRHAKSFVCAGVVTGKDLDGALYWESIIDNPIPVSPAQVLAYALEK